MAERRAPNVGEPADEGSVDGEGKPCGNVAEGGDQERVVGHAGSFGINSGDYNARINKVFADLDSANRSEFHFYDEQPDDGSPPSTSTDPEWNGLHTDDYQICMADVCSKIVPLVGAVSYEYFSLKIMNPSWFMRAFYGIDHRVSNALWIQSHIGIGLFIYSHKHIQAVSLPRRLLYSAVGSLMFNYSSCLFWAIGRNYLPRIESARAGFGLLTGWFLLFVGREYLHHVDKTCSDQID